MIDPTTAKVADVQAYLDAHPDDVEAVRASESEGQARKGIMEYDPVPPEVRALPEGATLVETTPTGRWYRLVEDGQPVQVDGKDVRLPHRTRAAR